MSPHFNSHKLRKLEHRPDVLSECTYHVRITIQETKLLLTEILLRFQIFMKAKLGQYFQTSNFINCT